MGRNAPCFCGSSKKKKKCHSQIKENSKLANMYRVNRSYDNYMDELGIRNTCPVNCNECCSHYFLVSENEFLMILEYLLSKGKEEFKKITDSAKEYEFYFEKNFPEQYKQLDSYMPASGNFFERRSFFDVSSHLMNIQPCIFLNDKGKCDVYEVRPHVCRTYGSSSGCYKLNNQEMFFKELDNLRESHILIKDSSQNSIAKRPYPLFYWFSFFLNEVYADLTLEKMQKIRDLSELNYYEFSKKLQQF